MPHPSPKINERLDTYVARALNCSRKEARVLVEQGRVIVGKHPLSKNGFLLKADSLVSFIQNSSDHAQEDSELVEKITLRPTLVREMGGIESFCSKIHEDEDLLVLDKRRAVHCVRQTNSDEICIADALAFLNPKASENSPNPLEGGLVNRLDFYTSGIVLAAKSRESWEKLHKLFLSDKVEKSYLALVYGRPSSDKALLEHYLELKKSAARVYVRDLAVENSDTPPADRPDAKGQKVTIEVQVEKEFGRFSLLRVNAQHLSRHQIRAQLSFAGYPLVGDELYGSKDKLADAVKEGFSKTGLQEGYWLRALELSFTHPTTGHKTNLSVPS